MFTVPAPPRGRRSLDDPQLRLLKDVARSQFRNLLIQCVCDKYIHLCNRLLSTVVAKLCEEYAGAACRADSAADAPLNPPSPVQLTHRDALLALTACCRATFQTGGTGGGNAPVHAVIDLWCKRLNATTSDSVITAMEGYVATYPFKPMEWTGRLVAAASAKRGIKRSQHESAGTTVLDSTQRAVDDIYLRALRTYVHHAPSTPAVPSTTAAEGETQAVPRDGKPGSKSAQQTARFREAVRIRLHRSLAAGLDSGGGDSTGPSAEEGDTSDAGSLPEAVPFKRSRIALPFAPRDAATGTAGAARSSDAPSQSAQEASGGAVGRGMMGTLAPGVVAAPPVLGPPAPPAPTAAAAAVSEDGGAGGGSGSGEDGAAPASDFNLTDSEDDYDFDGAFFVHAALAGAMHGSGEDDEDEEEEEEEEEEEADGSGNNAEGTLVDGAPEVPAGPDRRIDDDDDDGEVPMPPKRRKRG